MRLSEAAVGSLVYLTVSGTRTAFRVVQHGKPDSSYDDSFTGGVILMLDCSEEPVYTRMVEEVDQNKGDYSSSYMHQMLNSTWLARLDSAVAQQVVQVRLPYRKGTATNPYVVADGSAGLSARVWLPSIAEAARGTDTFESASGYYVQEGASFAYFKDAAASLYSSWKVLDPDTNGDEGWGTRTPGQYTSGVYADFFCKIDYTGIWYNGGKNPVYVRPCLVLPGTTLLDASRQVMVGAEIPVKIDGTWCAGVSWAKTDGVWHKTERVYGKVDGSWK